MKIASLFSGVGGLDLGLARGGHEVVLHCEIDPAARAVLAAHFPGAQIVEDVRALDRLPRVDLVAAGFPCQDLSQAGRTAGIDGERSGLVGEVFRLLDRSTVPAVLLENVPFMLRLDRGRAMATVASALEARGYRWAYRTVDSRAFGVPQRRRRVFLLATLEGDPRDVLLSTDHGDPVTSDLNWSLACGFYWTEGLRGLGWAVDAVPTLKGGSSIGIPSAPAVVLPDGPVGTPDIRDAERLQGLPEDWTLPATRVARAGHRWRLVGNAVTVGAGRWLGYALGVPGRWTRGDGEPLASGSGWPRAAWNVGRGRRVLDVGELPALHPTPHLHEFLRHDVHPLSARATRGFLSRAGRSTLRFPDGLLDRLNRHASTQT